MMDLCESSRRLPPLHTNTTLDTSLVHHTTTMAPSPDHIAFQPLKVGRMHLKHRIVMSPMTRCRASEDHVPSDFALEYYSQRASVPGTLLITEATIVSTRAGGHARSAGIFTAEQISAWKPIISAVHAKGSFMCCQLWAIGFPIERVHPPRQYPLVRIPPHHGETQDSFTVAEIEQYSRDFAQGARNAMEAGFDCVEVHCANSFLLDQFLHEFTNKRTDEYGGSIENRSRFPLEVVKAVVDAVGEDRTGVRISPWGNNWGMCMDDPVPQFSHFIQSLRDSYPDLAYIHLLEPPMLGPEARHRGSNDAFREIWKPKAFLSAHVFKVEDALRLSERTGNCIVFGRWFLANPDLPYRIKAGASLNTHDLATWYGPPDGTGYTDYPFCSEPQDIARLFPSEVERDLPKEKENIVLQSVPESVTA